jgi:hypothetical protein
MNKKPMIDRSFDEVDAAFEDWLETLSQDELDQLNELIDETNLIEDEVSGVQIVKDDEIAPKEEIVEPKVVEPKAEKVKCKCCGFAKKARRVNAEGICKVCYMALATSGGESVTVVGRQGKRGRNTVSVMIGGERVKVQRKVRLEA